ncbi:2-polyprenyl-6-methoxyphenol hydroxylase [Pseudonocardia thermophila]|jgi:2-polyprenyl-6-methoxyphenol hydroxylase and related FAD-dependent oxidoreductases|uniref:2-polyprenyl-6-methoxyphenol hydroxylase n=1 Tax=Pseudonocardia thermophila TaxID=1848 RepID=A0A1M6SBE5_PSETH|nr:FAD-dependent monooxygenase [Pseudonocardia thermophila]SHK42102.1 2-polyprenyl-6-methoxyphenol hydroxylase [Pseudonocardia thermophila]
MQVLIAGAGPTGLTLAIDLLRRGVDVRLVDQAETPFTGSRGDGLQPRTLEVFEDLGVLDAVLAAGELPKPIRAYRGHDVLFEKHMGEISEPRPDVPYPNGLMLGQSRTEEILRARLAELGGTVEFGTALVAFEQDTDGVTAILTSARGTETVRADHLVGADGGRSTVRKALGVPFVGVTDESIRMLIGDVSADALDREHVHWFGDPAKPREGVVLSPLPGTDQFQFAAPLDGEPTLEGLQALLDRASGRTDIRLRNLTWCTVWRPNVRLAAQFRVGRVFLAGDAAHVHPPTGGQGLNTGVQDAYNLGWKLASGDSALLDTYEAERRRVAQEVLELSTRIMRRYTDGAENAHERGAETSQLGITYRTAPASAGTVFVGDRAPDAPLRTADGAPVRLFELFRGPHATTLAFGVAAPAGPHSWSIAPAGATVPGALVDVDGHAHRAYGAAPGTVVEVRPDGYIGAYRVTEPAA